MTVNLAQNISFENQWYAVQTLDDRTFAIGEPLYHQQNWSYLFQGNERALLFDAGSFSRDISGVVDRLAPGALTVLPSHMHYDHLGNITRFTDIAVADLPILRACVTDGFLTPSEDLFLGRSENNVAPEIPVSRWLPIGSTFDLGGRTLSIIHTPGHSPDSISLFAPDENRLFAADFLYPGDLYAQVPGASLPDYLKTAEFLTGLLGDATEIYCAHGNRTGAEEHSAPSLRRQDLVDLVNGLREIEHGVRSRPWADETAKKVRLSDRLSIIIGKDAIADWNGNQ